MASITTDRAAPGDPVGPSIATGEDSTLAISAIVRYLVALVWRNLWLIGGIIAAALALAVVATMLDTPRYTAGTTLQINDQSDEVLGDEIEGSTQVVTSTWDVQRFLNTQLDILQSRGLAHRVAQKLELYEDDEFLETMGISLSDGDAMTTRQREDLVLGLLIGNLGVDLPRETRIVQLTYTSPDPATSARIANTFAEEFIQDTLQRRYDSSNYARNFVAEQLDEARARLETSEQALNDYARQAGLIRTRGANSGDEPNDNSDSVTAASLSQLNRAANAAAAERAAAEARWQAESQQPLLSSQAVLANDAVQRLLTERSRIESELAAQRSRYLDDHPAVRELRDQLQTTEAELDRLATSIRQSIRADYIAARSAEQRLAQQVSALQGETLAEQDRSVRYNTLAREADTNRSLYEGLLQRYRELNASAGIASSNISIIDRAEPPLSPSSPNLIINLLLALVLGTAAAGAVVFLRDQLDDAIRVPEDVENKTGMPLLGVIPHAEDDDIEAELEDPKSPVSEAYNSLRGSLLYSTPKGLPEILLVTSSQASEGKTTTSFAIARSLARMGKSVVLVDADLRRPSAHRKMGFDNKRGLSTLLTSQEPAASVYHPSPTEGLTIIPSGPIPPSPTELLTSPRIAALLQELQAAFDVVVLDSPPILGLADAPVISALADGVVFVIEAERSRRGMLKTAVRRLRAMNPVVLGAVLTKFDASKAANKYSEYYGYEYYHYKSADGREG